MKNSTKLCGRPAGRRKTAKIEVVIEPEIKEKFMRIITNEGSTASVELGRWIRNYIKEKCENSNNI